MGVEDPGMLKVTCDGCGEETDFDTTQYANDTFGVDSETLTTAGWSTEGSETFCEKCTKVANGEAEEEDEELGCG